MKKEILKNMLVLDSIYKVLPWTDRVRIHLLLQDRVIPSSPNIDALYAWTEKWRWLAPKLKYGQDRLPYFENSPGEWVLVEELKHIKLDLPCMKK